MRSIIIVLLSADFYLSAGDIEVSIYCEGTGCLNLFLVDENNFNKPMKGLIDKKMNISKSRPRFEDISFVHSNLDSLIKVRLKK